MKVASKLEKPKDREKHKSLVVFLHYNYFVSQYSLSVKRKEVSFLIPLFYSRKISSNTSKPLLFLRLQPKTSRIFIYIKKLINNKLASFLVVLDKKKSHFRDLLFSKKIKYIPLLQSTKGLY